MKLLILILSSRNHPHFEVFNEGIKKTYLTKEYKNVEIYPFYGHPGKTQLLNGELLLNCPDNYLTTKTLLAFEYAINNMQFDYLIRPNVSTYININKLYEYLLKQSRTNYYAGPKLNILNVEYPSGTFMVYSKDIVKKILEGKNMINDNQYADDWCIGKYLQSQNIKMTDDIPLYWLIEQWPETKILRKLYTIKKEDIENYIAFRCKTEVPADAFQKILMKRNDPLKMQYLHNLLNNE